MGRKDKLVEKLCNPTATMTWDELVTLMKQHGFEVINAKRGSARKFYHREKDLILRLHEPHPSKILKPYIKVNAIEALKNIGAVL